MSHDLRCSFCGKLQTEIPVLIAAPEATICVDCVAVCNDVLRAHQGRRLVEDLIRDFGGEP